MIEEYGLTSLKEELMIASCVGSVEKDILIAVHNELEYVRCTIESLQRNTKNYQLYLWDNGSEEPTASYLQKIADENDNVYLHREEENLGFIVPNNRMAEQTKSPYIIFLNSDCRVYEGWDTAMIGWLESHPKVAQVGYTGGHLDSKGKGVRFNCGKDIQYICGYCFCIPRETYDEFGLFDEENLQFAYCEDSDYSLRLQEGGKEIYALHVRLVHHFQNKTILSVLPKRDLSAELANNSAYIQSRWGNLLKD